MKTWKFIFMCVFIVFAALFFWRLVEEDMDIAGKTLVYSDEKIESDAHLYYMKNQGGNVIVYNKDHTVYEYTDLQPEFLPKDVAEELAQGVYFRNQEDLYDFLETYSS